MIGACVSGRVQIRYKWPIYMHLEFWKAVYIFLFNCKFSVHAFARIRFRLRCGPSYTGGFPYQLENVARSTFCDRAFCLKYKHSSGTKVLDCTHFKRKLIRKKSIARHFPLNGNPALRRISIQLKMSRDPHYAHPFLLLLQAFKRNECAWLHTCSN